MKSYLHGHSTLQFPPINHNGWTHQESLSGGLHSRHHPRTSLVPPTLSSHLGHRSAIASGDNCFQECLHQPCTSFLEAPPGGHFLLTFCHKHQHSWSQFLPWGENAKNSFHQPATRLTPFHCYPAASVSLDSHWRFQPFSLIDLYH